MLTARTRKIRRLIRNVWPLGNRRGACNPSHSRSCARLRPLVTADRSCELQLFPGVLEAEEKSNGEEHQALSAHIEEGYLQAHRGELIDGEQVPRNIQAMKNNWRSSMR